MIWRFLGGRRVIAPRGIDAREYPVGFAGAPPHPHDDVAAVRALKGVKAAFWTGRRPLKRLGLMDIERGVCRSFAVQRRRILKTDGHEAVRASSAALHLVVVESTPGGHRG